jgi:hypothetical protein
VESDIVTVDGKWEVEIADIKESGGSKTIIVSDNNGSSYNHTTPWGSCHYTEIEIKRVDMTIGNKEFGFTKGFEIRAYYKGDYEWDNPLDDTITNIGIFTGIAGKTKYGKQLMNSISKRIDPNTVSSAGLLIFAVGQSYDFYTRRYNKGLMPDYDILYSSFHN